MNKRLLFLILLILNVSFIKSAQVFGLQHDENDRGKQEAELKVERDYYPFPSTYRYLEKITKKTLTEKDLMYSILELCQTSYFKCTQTLSDSTFYHPDSFNSIIELRNGDLASCTNHGPIYIWRANEYGQFILIQRLSEGYTLPSFVSMMEMKTGDLVTGSADGTIRTWRTNESNQFICIQILEKRHGRWATGENFVSGWINSIIETRNGNLVSCSNDKTIKIWKANESGKFECIQTLVGHEDCISLMIEKKNGDLASYSYDKIVKIWRIDKSGQYICMQTMQSLINNFRQIILRNGNFVSFSDDTIKIWNEFDQLICTQTLHVHFGIIYSLIEMRNGNLASCSHDKTIKIWAPNESGQFTCTQTLKGHTHCVTSIVEMKNGDLASCSHDGTIKIWSKAIDINFKNKKNQSCILL